MSRVRVTIGRLALRGFDPGQARAVGEGLRAELARLLADPALRPAARPRRAPVLRLGALPMAEGGAGALGRAVARAIARGLSP